MDALNFTIPVAQLRGCSIFRGVTPGSWDYPGSGGTATSYWSAVAGQRRAIINHVNGRRSDGQDLRCCRLQVQG